MLSDIILDLLVVILILTNIRISMISRQFAKHKKGLNNYKKFKPSQTIESEYLNDVMTLHQNEVR